MLSDAQTEPVFPSQQPPQGPQNPAQFVQCSVTVPMKKNAITQDYKVTNKVLGSGINGKVIEVFRNKDGERFALKVSDSPAVGAGGRCG